MTLVCISQSSLDHVMTLGILAAIAIFIDRRIIGGVIGPKIRQHLKGRNSENK